MEQSQNVIMDNGPSVSVKPKRKRKTKEEIIFICALLAIPILHFIFFWIFINIDTISLSFQKFNQQTGKYEMCGFFQYKSIFLEFTKESSVLPRAIVNSLLVFIWNDFVIIPLSVISAYMLFKKMPLANMFKVVFFLPSIISAVVMTLVFRFMLNSSFGILDKIMEMIGLGKLIPFDGWLGDAKTAFPMILFYGLWTGIGYNIVLVTGAIARVPEEVYEAGKLDGLGLFQELWYIVIPLIGSTLSTLMLMGTTVIFTYFLQPLLLTGSNAQAVGTYTIAMYIVTNIKDGGNALLNLGAAVGVLCALVGTPIVIFSRKLLEKVFPVYEY